MSLVRRTASWWLFVLVLVSGCQPAEPDRFSYYEDRVEPVLEGSCARSPAGGGCHLPREDGTALGNLDLGSYDSLMRRRDLLAAYGPYSVGLFLLKAGDPIDVQVETFDPDPARRFVRITTDIRHNNGQSIALGSRGYALLKQWIEAGHPRNGVPDETLQPNLGACRSGVGSAPGWDPTFADRYPDSFNRFVSEVQPILTNRCAGSQCHGSTVADLYLSCGATVAEQQWNFWVTAQHVTSPVSTSELLRRPLSTLRGGVFHEGGNVFGSTEDPDYVRIRDWAQDLVTAHPESVAPPTDISDGLRYFANRVQPVLVRKGCMFMNCHSPSMFHELRLRGGAQGHFSRIATQRNYEASRLLLALDSPDPNESRIVAKNLYPAEQLEGSPGLFHRGGALFEDFGVGSGGRPNGATPDDCASFDVDNGDLNEVPAYCILARWHQIEREDAIAAGEIFPEAEVVRSVVWVSRPTGVGNPRDFDTYRPGADLVIADATYDAASEAVSLGTSRSLLAGCGLSASTADVRRPAVSWDGARIAFAARSSATTPLRLYWMQSDGTGCEPIPGLAPAMNEQDGILTHDLDPSFAPDGRIVFASSRGNLDAAILGRAGPTRTPAAMQPNANLYIFDPATNDLRQLTFLLNQEMQPSFMTDGRVIFTAEKREPDFHVLAGRRQNLDGGDYHPLFAQRPSVGYASATEIVELYDRNLALVGGPIDAADGAGTIVIVNRSIGPDQDDRSPTDRYYIASQRFPLPGAFRGGTGAFRSPSPLPSGRILVSCDRAATSLTSGNYDFDLCELDPDSGALRSLGGAPGRADIEAVAVVARAPRSIFQSKIEEANGTTRIEPGATDAEVEVLDFPLLATLLFSNTRIGRPISPDVGGFDVLASLPPPAGARTFADVSANVVNDAFGSMYVNRVPIGNVPLNADGSARFSYRGGLPIVLRVTGFDGQPLAFADGAPFSGEVVQREQMQFYPGERIRQSFPRTLFNGMCGGCHGSISNRELDVAADIDVLTRASQVLSRDQGPVGLAHP